MVSNTAVTAKTLTKESAKQNYNNILKQGMQTSCTGAFLPQKQKIHAILNQEIKKHQAQEKKTHQAEEKWEWKETDISALKGRKLGQQARPASASEVPVQRAWTSSTKRTSM